MGDGTPPPGQVPQGASIQSYSEESQGSIAPEQRSSGTANERAGSVQHHGYAYRQSGSPLNMQALSSALTNYAQPSAPFAQQQSLQQPYLHHPSQGVLYQMPQTAPFAGQAGVGQVQFGPQFSTQQFPQHYQQVINHPRQNAPFPSAAASNAPRPMFPQPFPTSQQQFHRSQGAYAPVYTGHSQQFVSTQQGDGFQRPPQYGVAMDPNIQGQQQMHLYQQAARQQGLATGSEGSFHLRPEDNKAVSRQSSASSLGPSAPRGPPPKPKQSGHALWIGNLPPNTTIFDLKDHFSQGATEDIESVFLISKSNCAFANYKTEAACAAAMQRFNDTRFLGAKLVCRLRKHTPSPPTGGSHPTSAPDVELPAQQAKSESVAGDAAQESDTADEVSSPKIQGTQPKVKEKFFVIKSLTVEDLELSVRNGVWATQAHNETALNHAFETAENVYLIFSANKSGEYFGYSRMLSIINDESASTIDFTPRNTSARRSSPDLPNKIPTPATAHAPKGYVIDDSARGTIFWEVESADDSPEALEEAAADDKAGNTEKGAAKQEATEEPASETQSFGRPFRIEWISTERLPFYRTRGLRNPWNSNREVKIARDGTELEPSVGRRLISMFHRPQVAAGSSALPQGQQSQFPPGYQPVPQFMGYGSSAGPQQQFYHGQ